jgi:ketosteroid isomerase-like protein
VTNTKEAVLSANQEFYAAFSRRDFGALTRTWAKERPVACVHPGWPALHGREQVLASFRAILSSPDAPNVRASDEVAVVLGDVAFVTCVEHVGSAELAATNVFALESGAWRMVHHHASPMARSRPSTMPPSSSLN